MRQLVCLLCFVAASAGAQSAPGGSPLWIAERLFDPAGFPGIESYVSPGAVPSDSLGNVATFASVLPAGTRAVVELVAQDPETAVVAARIGAGLEMQDVYFHFQTDHGRWWLAATRSLDLPDDVVGMLGMLEAWETARIAPDPAAVFWSALDPFTIKSLQMSSEPPPEGIDAEDRMFMDAMLTALPSMRLIVAPDSMLRAHFSENRAAFDSLASAFLASSPGYLAIASDETEIGRSLRNLRMQSIRQSFFTDPYVFVLFYGAQSVGYLYAPDGGPPPEMSPLEYIYVEPLGEDWYLFKTT